MSLNSVIIFKQPKEHPDEEDVVLFIGSKEQAYDWMIAHPGWPIEPTIFKVMEKKPITPKVAKEIGAQMMDGNTDINPLNKDEIVLADIILKRTARLLLDEGTSYISINEPLSMAIHVEIRLRCLKDFGYLESLCHKRLKIPKAFGESDVTAITRTCLVLNRAQMASLILNKII